ncbi:hypothetical protein QLL95_gp0305 [Cotonvirus japonicus]|uniref:Uncharacterized protein n=1 Tax=Cotonvirus japonicus TaxID=2811091 RepID=A0ABM7NRL7_9VIRU|nr:hypothetical protein QLL95_gp0305 [Cotonvirus japonicus]BCS82794.1 hypothetical protein [Cotonvirus japonicus]
MDNMNNKKIAMIIIIFYTIISIFQGNYHFGILGAYYIIKNIFELKFNKGIELSSINYTIIGVIVGQFAALVLIVFFYKYNKFTDNPYMTQIITTNMSIVGYTLGSFWYRSITMKIN